MITVIYLYICWFFLNNLVITSYPALGWIGYGDELFLIMAIPYLTSNRRVLLPLRRYGLLYLALVVVFSVSFLYNASLPLNFLLVLSSYTKPLVFGAVLFVMFEKDRPSYKKIFSFFVLWCIVQLPFFLVQMFSGEGLLDNIDDMVGTFGFAGSLEPGYLAGILACVIFPQLVEERFRALPTTEFLLCALVTVITGSKQVFLLTGISVVAYLLFFGRRRAKAIIKVIAISVLVLVGVRSLLNIEMFASDLEIAEWMIRNFQESRKAEGVVMTSIIFRENPTYYVLGTGPGMFTSYTALKTETQYAKIVNYAYYLQKPGEAEEGQGGTFNQSSSSFLTLIGENGFLGYLLFIVLIWSPFFVLRQMKADATAIHSAFVSSAFITLAMFFQNILEGGVAINFFWGLNAVLMSATLSAQERVRVQEK